LYHNLRERLERILANKPSKEKDQASKPTSKRQKRFEYVQSLYAKGYSTRTIARVLEMNRRNGDPIYRGRSFAKLENKETNQITA
jgi:hypothetical protein